MKTQAGKQRSLNRSRTRRHALAICYITCCSAAQARRISQALLAERLAACTNLLPRMESRYWWQGRLERARESVLIVKTRRALVPAITDRVRSLHSYTVPCVLSLPVEGGNPGYLDWLAAETAPVQRAAARRKPARE